MTQTINITAGEGDTADTVVLNGIPAEIWAKFKEHAQRQFPANGELAWAAFLSEVIVAAGGGDGETVSYFMTKVPWTNAQKMADLLANVSLTWEQFHAYLLRAVAVSDTNVRLLNFTNTNKSGTVIALGIDPLVFENIQQATGKTPEIVLATVLASAANGALSFGPDTQWIEPVKTDA